MGSSCRCVDCRDFEKPECLFEREIAENTRLRAELEATKVRYQQACEGRAAFMEERNLARVQVEELQAENERLRERLEFARVVFQGLANTRSHPAIHSLQQWAKSWLAIDARKGSLSVKQFLAECGKEEKNG